MNRLAERLENATSLADLWRARACSRNGTLGGQDRARQGVNFTVITSPSATT